VQVLATWCYGGTEPAPRVTASTRDSRLLGLGDVCLIRFGDCEVKLHASGFTVHSDLKHEVWNMTILDNDGNLFVGPAKQLYAVLFGVRS
jgi:hypothetical protein